MIYLGNSPVGVAVKDNTVLPSFINKIDGGTVQFDEDTATTITINHNLGEKPICVVFYTDEGSRGSSGDGYKSMLCAVMTRNAVYESADVARDNMTYVFTANSSPVAYPGQGNSIGITDWWNDNHFKVNPAGSIGQFLAGRKYHWLAWV